MSTFHRIILTLCTFAFSMQARASSQQKDFEPHFLEISQALASEEVSVEKFRSLLQEKSSAAKMSVRDFINQKVVISIYKHFGEVFAIETAIGTKIIRAVEMPLLHACSFYEIKNPRPEHHEKFKVLIEYGINIHAKDCQDSSALFFAIKHKHIPLISWLIESGSDIYERRPGSQNTLVGNIIGDNAPSDPLTRVMLRELLGAKQEVARNKTHFISPSSPTSPYIVDYVKSIDFALRLQSLSAEKANTIRSSLSLGNGNTLLHVLADLGQAHLIPAAFKIKEDAYFQPNLEGYRPIHMATLAAMDAFDLIGSIPEHYLETISQLVSLEKLFLSSYTRQGLTPLHLAVERKNLPLIRFLIMKGAKPFDPKLSPDGVVDLSATPYARANSRGILPEFQECLAKRRQFERENNSFVTHTMMERLQVHASENLAWIALNHQFAVERELLASFQPFFAFQRLLKTLERIKNQETKERTRLDIELGKASEKLELLVRKSHQEALAADQARQEAEVRAALKAETARQKHREALEKAKTSEEISYERLKREEKREWDTMLASFESTRNDMAQAAAEIARLERNKEKKAAEKLQREQQAEQRRNLLAAEEASRSSLMVGEATELGNLQEIAQKFETIANNVEYAEASGLYGNELCALIYGDQPVALIQWLLNRTPAPRARELINTPCTYMVAGEETSRYISPLALAIELKNLEMVKLLLQKGARADIASERLGSAGFSSPLKIAISACSSASSEEEKTRCEAIKNLILKKVGRTVNPYF